MTLTTTQRTELDILDRWIHYAKLIQDEDVLQRNLKQKADLLESLQGTVPPTSQPIHTQAKVSKQSTQLKLSTKRRNLSRDRMKDLALEFSQMTVKDIKQHPYTELLTSLARTVGWVIRNPGCTNRDISDALGLSTHTVSEQVTQLIQGGFPITKRLINCLNTPNLPPHTNTYYCDPKNVRWYEIWDYYNPPKHPLPTKGLPVKGVQVKPKQIKVSNGNLNREGVLSIAPRFSQMSLTNILEHKRKRLLLTLADCLDFIIQNPGCTTQDIYAYMECPYNSGTLRGYLKALADGGFPIRQVLSPAKPRDVFTYHCKASDLAWYRDYKQFTAPLAITITR